MNTDRAADEPAPSAQGKTRAVTGGPTSASSERTHQAGGVGGTGDLVRAHADEPRPPIRRLGSRRVVSGTPPSSTAHTTPQQTRDDTDTGWGNAVGPDESGHDAWLRRQRPPHWG